jgi:hypothetical protein
MLREMPVVTRLLSIPPPQFAVFFLWNGRVRMGSRIWLASTFAVLLTFGPAWAQQITGTPGSPSATETIDGAQLPPPPTKFEGKIDFDVSKSTPYWPPRVAPPKGAPNVLLIMTDDVGFGAPSTFGGVIPTPTMDRVAREGLRFTNFHSPHCVRRHARLL